MLLRTISKNEIKDPSIGYFRDMVRRSVIANMDVKFTFIRIFRNRKIVDTFYGELVYFEGEGDDVKVILPNNVLKRDNNKLVVKDGDLFMGKRFVTISNPREMPYTTMCIFDIDVV